MRSMTELVTLAQAAGVEIPVGATREAIMDLLRDKDADPALQIDPMKAVDLKNKIKAEADDPYAAVRAKYFNAQHVMEPKIDGARMRLWLGAQANTMNTGRRSDRTFAYIQRENNFPHLRDAVLADLAGTILDGEVVAPSAEITTESGVTTSSLLNATVALVNCAPELSVRTQEREGRVRYVVFDLLSYKGESVTDRSYTERRKLMLEVVERLSQLAPEIEAIPSWESTDGSVTRALAEGYEGVMIKRTAGVYQAGKRSSEWAKIKAFGTMDVVVTGWTPGEGRNLGKVGALKVSLKDELGLWVEVAQHGAFTDEYRALISLPDGSLDPAVLGTVQEITGQGVTKGMRVRHPHLVRLRPDKTPDECGLEQLAALPRV